MLMASAIAELFGDKVTGRSRWDSVLVAVAAQALLAQEQR